MGELISVIVPVYNAEKHLAKCLFSICENTYRTMEIILINDGSTDNTEFICNAWQAKDPRISVLHQENSGVSAARNAGIQCATGKYIAFIDSDDYIPQNYFAELHKDIAQNRSDLSICPIVHSGDEAISPIPASIRSINLQQVSSKDQSFFQELNQKYYLYGPVNKLYLSEIIKVKNIAFPEDTSYGEDLLFNFSYLEHCHILSYTCSTCYYYNTDNNSSLSHKYREDLFENGLRLNSAIFNYCHKHNFLTEEMRSYIARRIVDDAYSNLMGFSSTKCTLTKLEKLQRIRYIMNHNAVQIAFNYADVSAYSTMYMNLIRRKQSLAFFFTQLLKGRYK